MNNERSSLFFKAIMTGLFVGVVDTVICLVFNIIYRSETGFIPSAMINVSSLIFAINILLTFFGIVFFFFLRAFKKGDMIFAAVAAALTGYCLWKIMGMTRFGDATLDSGFRGLLGGITFVLGLSTTSIPFLYRSERFVEAVI